MRNITKLYEAYHPGKIVGKKVMIYKTSEAIGVCTGVVIDLDKKAVFIMASGKNTLHRIRLEDIIEVTDDAIFVDTNIPAEGLTEKELNAELADLRHELALCGGLLLEQVYSKRKGKNIVAKNLDMARLLHLV